MKKTVFVILIISAAAVTASAYDQRRENSILLNGKWQYNRGAGDEEAFKIANQPRLDWNDVNLPGQFMEWTEERARNIDFIWAKRSFDISAEQANSLAVLRWNHIRLGATAYINGQKVGQNEPTGPYQTMIPANVLKKGSNQIVLKIPGAGGVHKAKNGTFLIPSGFCTNSGRAMPAVTQDIWIDFSGGAYIKWALAICDLKNEKVKIRVTPIAPQKIADITLTAQVRPFPKGSTLGNAKITVTAAQASEPLEGKHYFIEVPMPGFEPWTYENQNLYQGHLELTKDGKLLDKLDLRFGMRNIDVQDGNYKMNGKNLWLRGSNLVFEWEWAPPIKGHEKEYLVDEARKMSMNCFRTHTQPPPPEWLNICDEHGTMILAEFPVLFNGKHYRFTEEEWEIWHKNVLTDAVGWMSRLWNHPSVIMYVLTNESPTDHEWEAGPYRDFVTSFDPTRPTMRAGAAGMRGTKTNYDVHTCFNTIHPLEGKLLENVDNWFKAAKGRTTTNSEYMNIFDRPITQWTGKQDKAADRLAYAQLGAEHTEAMRRARLDGILPYMYAGWTTIRTGQEWKTGFARPVSACFHSTLSPVLASLDLFNPNYLTDQEITTDLYLINDSWQPADIHVELLLTKENPEFIPDANCLENPLAKWSFDYQLQADSLRSEPVKWKLPSTEGNYWLTAKTTGPSVKSVLSQRFVRAVAPPQVPPAAKQKTFVLLGSDEQAKQFFKAKGLETVSEVNSPDPKKHMVIIWNAAKLSGKVKKNTDSLLEFASAGGKIAVLSTSSWDWSALADVSLGRDRGFSRIFAYGNVTHPMLYGIHRKWLMRWNGLPGTVALTTIEGPAMKDARKILWAREPGNTVVAEVPINSSKKGYILFSQLAIQSHLDKSAKSYDPVAERLLLNLLAQ